MAKTKKVERKHVKILNFEQLKKRVAESQYNKFQLFMAKMLKIEPAEKFQYLFRIHYKGNARLKSQDVIANKQGVLFAVVKEEQRYAIIATVNSYIQRPDLYGNLYIIDEANPNTIK